MLELKFIRENRELVKEMLANRNSNIDLTEFDRLDEERRAILGDQAPEALLPLFDREVEGFGEVFRMLSFEEIGTSTLQSRAVAGVANKTLIFAMPGSTKACRTAWENIIAPQLDARTRPCNFHPHLKK